MAESFFQVSSINLSLADKCVDIAFSKDVDFNTITHNSVVVLNKYTNRLENTDLKVIGNRVIVTFLDEPVPNAEYAIYIHPVIKSLIEGLPLDMAINRTIIFDSEVTSRVIITSPVDYEKFDGTELRFAWREFGTVPENNYRVQIASDHAFNNIVWDVVVAGKQEISCEKNIVEGQYYIRIRAEKLNAETISEFGIWSNVVTFLTADYQNETDSDTEIIDDNTVDDGIIIEDRISANNEVTADYVDIYEIMPECFDIIFSENINTDSAVISVIRRDV